MKRRKEINILKESKYIHTLEFQQPNYPMTFIIGARGVGKTVNSLADNIKKCYADKTQFIYLRRFQTEIDTLGLPLDLLSKLTGLEVTREVLKDDSGRTSNMILANGKPVGFLLALSVAAKYKSNDYSKVVNVIYDEFIDIRNRELKNETTLFMNFMMTVFRDFSKYQVLFLANATNIFNCYFLDFEVLPHGRITKFKDLGIKIVMYQTSLELATERAKTALAKQVLFLEGDDGSSLANSFNANFEDFIHPLTKKSKQKRILKLNGVNYGLYFDNSYPANIISNKFNAQVKVKNACSFGDVSEEFPLMSNEDFLNLKALFRDGKLFFTDAKTRTVFMKLIKKGSILTED